MREVWYQWKVINTDDGMRFIDPWGDPMEHEYPMDLLFLSPEDAKAFIEDHELDDEARDWVLVRVTYESVEDK